jgi:ABC-2 type transport system ATP-binding protein
MLELKDFSKSYGEFPVIQSTSLHIPEGIHWVKGTNGSGKSTFFRCVAGIVPYTGKIHFKGLDPVRDAVAYRLLLNMGEAEPLYPDFLSGLDLLQFIRKANRGTSEQLLALAERFQVQSYWKQPTGTYSSGMCKKIALIAAFLGHPELIILDEPLITLDRASVGEVYALIDESYTRDGVNFLLSSHQDFQLEQLPIAKHFLVQEGKIFEV